MGVNKTVPASENFKQQLQAAYAAYEVGQVLTFRRTLTAGDVALFCGVSGDFNAYHIDESFARETWFGRRIVPGLLTASLGTYIGGQMGFLAQEMHFEFVAPVFFDDTITATVTVVGKDDEQRTLRCEVVYTNQAGETVVRGSFSGFPARAYR